MNTLACPWDWFNDCKKYKCPYYGEIYGMHDQQMQLGCQKLEFVESVIRFHKQTQEVTDAEE